jgi:4-hydroxy-tetrahydrodipicolinate reductase
LAEGLIKNNLHKTSWKLEDNSNPKDVVIKSFRVDPVPGTHVIKYQSKVDDIEIKHTAHSREGFALGAVMVAEWLAGKKGVYSMDDFLKF